MMRRSDWLVRRSWISNSGPKCDRYSLWAVAGIVEVAKYVTSVRRSAKIERMREMRGGSQRRHWKGIGWCWFAKGRGTPFE